MKMKPEHYAQLEQAIQRVQSEHPTQTVEVYHKAGLTAERFRWDMMWESIRKGYHPRLDCDEGSLYSYCNDTHIDAALRRITDTK